MEDFIKVERINWKPMKDREFEIVERKGRGHPDYIADSIAEITSRYLCRTYKERFGRVLHHNVDKVLVVGGQAWRTFGKGEVLQPIYIMIAGRVTTEVELKGTRHRIPVGPLIIRAAQDWLRENFREYLDVERHVIIDYRIGSGAVDLTRLVEKEIPLANDTSVGLSFAPLTETEELVLRIENYLNSPELKKELPQVGEDVKVMGLREGDLINVTIAVAMMCQHIKNLEEYRAVKEEIKERVLKIASEITDREVKVHVNTADDYSKGSDGVYLVVTGTSAEHGDDGATGRGNRVHGLITPLRPMSLEATAGKNPTSHVGKVYNVLADRIASRIYREVDSVEEVYVYMLSQIGKRIDRPQILGISIIPESAEKFNNIRYEATNIAIEELSVENILKISDEIIQGKVRLF
ncbi:MAG: methionine adenosyltransferase [Thermoprotei archaeon]|nr:MAG: methionine adenosyltransferase [Thermoprotei archaeon]